MSSGQRDITLRFLAEPGDVNFGGKVHGGAVMKWIDLAAYACSAAWSGKYCITAYAGGIRSFKDLDIIQDLGYQNLHRQVHDTNKNLLS